MDLTTPCSLIHPFPPFLQRYTVTGIDQSGPSLAKAEAHAQARIALGQLSAFSAPRYVLGSAYALPLAAASADAVVISDVLEHLLDLPRALAEIHRVRAPPHPTHLLSNAQLDGICLTVCAVLPVAQVLRPGGLMVFDTIDRTAWSLLSTWLVAQELTTLIPVRFSFATFLITKSSQKFFRLRAFF